MIDRYLTLVTLVIVWFPNPLAPGSDIQIHVSWGTRLLTLVTLISDHSGHPGSLATVVALVILVSLATLVVLSTLVIPVPVIQSVTGSSVLPFWDFFILCKCCCPVCWLWW